LRGLRRSTLTGLCQRSRGEGFGGNIPCPRFGEYARVGLGVTVIPLDARLTDVERRFLMDFAGVKGVICSRDYLMEMEEAKKDLKLDFILSMEDLDKIFQKY
jgi:long-subunit acyl-CoA synthetase (AMP-forming)